MGSVRDFFVSEAAECLAAIERLLDEAQGPIAADELLRHARTLRGSAQMAREDEVMTTARALEAAARAIGDGTIAWTPDAAQGVRDTVDDLRALVDASEPDDERTDRIRRAIERWRQPGVRLPEPPAQGAAGSPAGITPAGTAAARPAGPAGVAVDAEKKADAEARSRIEFHAYVAAEVSGILSTVEAALHRLERVPRDREPLKSILRRQRALLGSARLESLTEIAETLRSIDKVCRLIARRDVPVQGEWHDFFRAARDVLADAAARLMDGQAPDGSSALRRMTALRDALQAGEDAEVPVQAPSPPAIGEADSEVGDFFRAEARLLLGRVEKLARELDGAAQDRQTTIRRELDATLSALRDTAGTFGYPNPASLAEAARLRARRGTGAELIALLPGLSNAVEATAGATAAAPHTETAAPSPEAGQGDVVPVEELLYRGEAAIRRAHELRPTLERAIAGDPAARDALEELYDLLDHIRS